MAQKQIIIQKFDGGISDDIREQSSNKFAITKHFEIFSNPNRLTPHIATVADTNDGSTSTGMKQYIVQDFLYTSYGYLYGLGRKAASSQTKLFYKTAINNNWTVPASSESALALVRGCLFEFNDYAWGFESTNKVFQYGTISGTPTYSANGATLSATITSVANGLIGRDSNGYMFYNNIVVKIVGTTVTEVLTLPSYLRITSATRYNQYLAIACAPKVNSGTYGKSVVFLWDYVSTDVTETIDWGDGQLMVLEMIEGRLIGVIDKNLASAAGISPRSITIKEYNNTGSSTVKELFAALASPTNYLKQYKAVKNNKLYFLASLAQETPGVSTGWNEGIWVFGRRDTSSSFGVTLDYVEEAATLNNAINSFGVAGDYFEIAYAGDGSITKTVNDTSSLGFTSIWESLKYNGGDINLPKKLVSISVSTVPLPAAAVIQVYYKKNSETSWTKITPTAGITTDNAVSDTRLNISGAGTLPEFNEIQFRVESTGGGEMTGFKFVYDELKPEYKTFT